MRGVTVMGRFALVAEGQRGRVTCSWWSGVSGDPERLL